MRRKEDRGTTGQLLVLKVVRCWRIRWAYLETRSRTLLLIVHTVKDLEP